MKVLGFFLLLIVLYVGGLVLQNNAAASLCERYPEGTPLDDFDSVEGATLLSPRGPLPDPERPGVETITYCASLSMCDTACDLEIRDGAVIRSELIRL